MQVEPEFWRAKAREAASPLPAVLTAPGLLDEPAWSLRRILREAGRGWPPGAPPRGEGGAEGGGPGEGGGEGGG